MTRPEHYAEAERLLKRADTWLTAELTEEHLPWEQRVARRDGDLAAAAVHAQLASCPTWGSMAGAASGPLADAPVRISDLKEVCSRAGSAERVTGASWKSRSRAAAGEEPPPGPNHRMVRIPRRDLSAIVNGDLRHQLMRRDKLRLLAATCGDGCQRRHVPESQHRTDVRDLLWTARAEIRLIARDLGLTAGAPR